MKCIRKKTYLSSGEDLRKKTAAYSTSAAAMLIQIEISYQESTQNFLH